MGREYFCGYHSYLESMEALNDAECGRLFRACLTYSRTGAEPELRGNERFVWPGIRAQMDRDREKYQAISDRRAETGRKGGDAKAGKSKQNKQTQANAGKSSNCYVCQNGEANRSKSAKEKEKEKEKEKAKENSVPPIPPLGGGDALQAAAAQWLAYKRERHEDYKPTGLSALFSRLRRAAETYGGQAVADIIEESISNGWKGIIFEHLEKRQTAPPKAERPTWSDLAQEMAEGGWHG